MTPKEKAKELIYKYYDLDFDMPITLGVNDSKQCVLVCVDEIIKSLLKFDEPDLCDLTTGQADKDIRFWKEVKQEINNL